jgi:hypothetical protein
MSRLRILLVTLLLALPTGVAHASVTPHVNVLTPSVDANVEPGIPMLIAGTAYNGESGGVVSVEISFDAGVTWQQTDYANETWSYQFNPIHPTTYTFITRASTSSVVGDPTSPVTIHADGAGQLPPIQSENILFLPDLPGKPRINEVDGLPVEVGLRTRFDRAGHVTGAIIHRGSYTGPVQLRVWGSDETLLAEQPGGSAAYTQRIMFSTPVPVSAGEDYVVSYYTPEGGYAQTEDYFTGSVIRAPFMALWEGPGVYHYGEGGGFPANTWNNANYWVQPIFS